ncbi:hypothetical protein [Streptomyces sp. NBC_00996]|uniref:hypothetical protein n=1 Tax=Streptomyces sp. NBC_00996 TaxID=2903710 RepID=UPI00386BA88B|nr:hypothetical protein OG390_33095 [Streptomyces sp. NBC_00996]
MLWIDDHPERIEFAAVFLISRTTPNREGCAQELGANVGTSGQLLFQYIDAAYEQADR